MRLIDADKLELKQTVRIHINGLEEYFACYSYHKADIEEATTVDAIPVEWVEKYMNKFQLYGVCGDEYFILHNMLCAWEWEKENETDR